MIVINGIVIIMVIIISIINIILKSLPNIKALLTVSHQPSSINDVLPEGPANITTPIICYLHIDGG